MFFKRAIIDESLPLDRIDIVPVPDIGIHPLWVSHLMSLIPRVDKAYSHNPLVRRLLMDAGYQMDETGLLERSTYSGRHIRDLMRWGGEWEPLVPDGVVEIIKELKLDERVREIGEVTIKR